MSYRISKGRLSLMLIRTLILSLCCLVVASARAEDLTLRDGTVLKNVTVTSVTPAYISVTHAAGVARIMLQDLPPELQKRYGYDPQKAAQYAAADAAAQRRLVDQQQAAAKAAATQKAKEAALRQRIETGSQTIVGSVSEVADGGAFVELYETYPIASHSTALGLGEGAAVGYRPSGRTIYVQGLSGVTDGESVTIQAYRDGIYRSGDDAGSHRTLEKWVFISAR